MIFESYGVDKYFEPHKESSYYLLRLMIYRVTDASEGNLGVRPHTDTSCAATIPQLSLDGLEIETKDGQWIACELLPYSYVYLAGDALMVCHTLPFFEGYFPRLIKHIYSNFYLNI